MSRFSPALRVALLGTWVVALVGTLGAYAGLLATGDVALAAVVLGGVCVPGGVVVCALTHPGGLAIFTKDGYRTWIGWWTTTLFALALNVLIALPASFVVGSEEPWRAAVVFSSAVAVGHLVGLLVYYFLGELIVSLVLVATARKRDVPAPLDRLAAGLIMPLVIAFGAALGGGSGQSALPAGASKSDRLELLLVALFRVTGTPHEQLFVWLARACAVALVGCVVWLLVLVQRGNADRKPPRHSY